MSAANRGRAPGSGRKRGRDAEDDAMSSASAAPPSSRMYAATRVHDLGANA